jgi:hypothetical protein
VIEIYKQMQISFGETRASQVILEHFHHLNRDERLSRTMKILDTHQTVEKYELVS